MCAMDFDDSTHLGTPPDRARDARHSWVPGWELSRAIAERDTARAEVERLRGGIAEHHRQKADDRCIEDDDRLYAAAGLPPCDRRVGDKAAMLANCKRFIERRCEGGGWPTYAELEANRDELLDLIRLFVDFIERHHAAGYGINLDERAIYTKAKAAIRKAAGLDPASTATNREDADQ